MTCIESLHIEMFPWDTLELLYQVIDGMHESEEVHETQTRPGEREKIYKVKRKISMKIKSN